MRSLSKKTLAFVFALSSVAVAAGLISKAEVNQKIALLAAPYNDETTSLKLEFTDLNVDEIRALDFGMGAFLAKKGTANELVLKLENAVYHYGDGRTPTATGDLSLQLDLVKVFGQEFLNGAVRDFDDLVKGITSDYTQKYGPAAAVDAKIEDVKTDALGNVEFAKVRINVAIDMNQLPVGLNVEDVEFQSLNALLSVGRAGLNGSLKVVLNPLNKGFKADQPGLKEFIEKLLSEDAQTYQEISEVLKVLNGFADGIVNQEPPPADPQP